MEQFDTTNALNEFKGPDGIGIKSLFSFDRFIFPRIAKGLFIFFCILLAIGLLFMVVMALVALVQGKILGAVGMLLGGVLYAVLLMVGMRAWTELMLVGFKMNDTLTEIKELLKQKQ